MLAATAALVAFSQSMKSFKVHHEWTYEVTVDGDELAYDDHKGKDEYNLWSGAAQLWADDARFLSIVLVIWSGVLPYFKIAVASSYLWICVWFGNHSDGAMRQLLSVFWTIGRLAFFDVWCVAASLMLFHLKIHDYK